MYSSSNFSFPGVIKSLDYDREAIVNHTEFARGMSVFSLDTPYIKSLHDSCTTQTRRSFDYYMGLRVYLMCVPMCVCMTDMK